MFLLLLPLLARSLVSADGRPTVEEALERSAATLERALGGETEAAASIGSPAVAAAAAVDATAAAVELELGSDGLAAAAVGK